MTQGKAVSVVLCHCSDFLIIGLSGFVNNRSFDNESDAKTHRTAKALRAKTMGTAYSIFAKLWCACTACPSVCGRPRIAFARSRLQNRLDLVMRSLCRKQTTTLPAKNKTAAAQFRATAV